MPLRVLTQESMLLGSVSLACCGASWIAPYDHAACHTCSCLATISLASRQAPQHSSAAASQRWLIKLEDEPTATGTAFVDAVDVRDLVAARADALRNLAAARRAASATSAAAEGAAIPDSGSGAISGAAPAVVAAEDVEGQRLAAVQRLTGLLLRGLRTALHIVAPAAYPSYRAFVRVCDPCPPISHALAKYSVWTAVSEVHLVP